MPLYVRIIGRWGNALLALCFALFTLFTLFGEKRSLGLAFFFALPAVLGAFNIFVIGRSARLLAEEEWLRGEVRKAELRRRLHDMAAEEARIADGAQATPTGPLLSLPPADRGGGMGGSGPD